MTKKDHELIANVIKESILPLDWNLIGKATLEANFCKALRKDNPKFNMGKFLYLCGNEDLLG